MGSAATTLYGLYEDMSELLVVRLLRHCRILPLLMRGLQGSWKVQRQAIASIVGVKSEQIIPPLTTLLTDDDETIRFMTAMALIESQQVAAIQPVLDQYLRMRLHAPILFENYGRRFDHIVKHFVLDDAVARLVEMHPEESAEVLNSNILKSTSAIPARLIKSVANKNTVVALTLAATKKNTVTVTHEPSRPIMDQYLFLLKQMGDSAVSILNDIFQKGSLHPFESFDYNDIRDVYALLSQLTNPHDALSEFIGSHGDMLTLINAKEDLFYCSGDNYDRGASMVQAIHELTRQLNVVISKEHVYDISRFSGIELSEDTLNALNDASNGVDMIELNRRLLEDAYPFAIVNWRLDIRLMAAEFLQHLNRPPLDHLVEQLRKRKQVLEEKRQASMIAAADKLDRIRIAYQFLLCMYLSTRGRASYDFDIYTDRLLGGGCNKFKAGSSQACELWESYVANCDIESIRNLANKYTPMCIEPRFGDDDIRHALAEVEDIYGVANLNPGGLGWRNTLNNSRIG